MVISHIYKENERWIIQSNKEHLEGVAKLASVFASEFCMSSWGKMLGMLHDIGKQSNAFQQHIKKESGYPPSFLQA